MTSAKKLLLILELVAARRMPLDEAPRRTEILQRSEGKKPSGGSGADPPEHDVEIVRDAMLRQGMSAEQADEVVASCLEEWHNGTPDLLEILRDKALH